MKINICFIADNGYIKQTAVAITSIIANKKRETSYDIYVLTSGVSDGNKKKLKELSTKNVNIFVIELKADKELGRFAIKGIPATPSAIYKFNIPTILKSLDKVVYIDGDTLVMSDLSELYETNIEGVYAGVVKEAGGLATSLYGLCVSKNVLYFNSGVMLMNLSLMRKDKIPERLIDYREHGYNELMDQDALNAIFKNHVLELPFRYNTQLMFADIQKNIDKLKRYLYLNDNVKSTDEIIDEAEILHFSGKRKPWKNTDGIGNDLWVSYYDRSPFASEKLERIKYRKQRESIIDFTKRQLKNIRRRRFIGKFKR